MPAGDIHARVAARVKALGLGAGEHRGAHAEWAVVHAVCRKGAGAPQHDEGGFLFTGIPGGGLPRREFQDAEFQVFERTLP